MNVLWKDVPGYCGKYQISNTGIVRYKNGIRKQLISWDGYCYVKLSINGNEKKHKIHRLVALAFIPNPCGYNEINHKNEIKTDNRVENLEWCDRAYNNRYGNRNKIAGDSIRIAKQKAVLCYSKNGIFLQLFESVKKAGEILNKCPSAISECARGKRKSAYGFIWKYNAAKGRP